MRGLQDIWKIGGFLADQNGDGVPDRVNVSMELKEGCVPQGLIDFCGRLGFETTALSFGFLGHERAQWHVVFRSSLEETFCALQGREVVFFYKTISELDELLLFLSAAWPGELAEYKHPICKVKLDGKAVIVNDELKIDAFYRDENTAASKKMVITGLTDIWNESGFLMKEEPSPLKETNVSFDFQQEPSLSLLKQCCYMAARIGMSSTKLHFPMTTGKGGGFSFSCRASQKGSPAVLVKGTGVELEGSEDSLLDMMGYLANAVHVSEGGDFGVWEQLPTANEEEELLFKLEWKEEPEIERAKKELASFLKGYASPAQLSAELFISEPLSERNRLKQELASQYGLRNVEVHSAFKPAYLWIEEKVLPRLSLYEGNAHSIEIECVKESREDCLELPIRWIQELYPVDLLIEKEIGISADNIRFSLIDEAESTICVKLLDDQGQLLIMESLNIPVSKMKYVEEGKFTYPTTGQVVVKDGEHILFEKRLPTDRELFYQYYQHEVLPLLWKETWNRTEGQGFTKPLFDRVEIEAAMSEEERRLNIDEERISSMEALHEDLYFNTLDYFTVRGEKEFGNGFPAPGGVYPFMKSEKGSRPKAKITAYKWRERDSGEAVTTKLVFDQSGAPVKAILERVEDGKTFERDIGTSDFKRDFRAVLDRHKLDAGLVRQWIPATSYNGEKIPVFEMVDRIEEQFFSPIKCSLFKPTVLIEAGHHANEVSSTPAIIELVQELSTEESSLLKKVNLVVIPCANPDGARLHDRMTADNPEWKQHAARYNAVGLEYAHVRYKKTVFGEADVVPLIMKRWAPDIIIDDHGIPSHEWVQPFAGYNSPPRFPVSYWIPNALIYGIGRELDGGQYPGHVHNLSVIADRIDQKLKGTDIYEKNHYWVNRVKKYGHQWLPDIFPIEQTNDLLFYKWKTETNEDSFNGIERYPEWVCADIISEAADETVYGEALDICKKAHKLFDLAIIEAAAETDTSFFAESSESVIELRRQRPLRLEGVKRNEEVTINRL
ncbi:hypothetical protein AS034_15380 [[Bacillus] enclensis]|uniref:Zinc carboxypeptidase n=1 Tax=[Bacillus] enclensis TaxID=1402860 RepID=A0A0V8HET2_9BACI|nr:M14 family metallopeptidase [[Bacillus] enclensis]KSU61020.1 hypothetical protein AS034_15380 [[Bacillus] enclensis]SCC21967.1 Zinc carboxypeptidase [[Bacillus] enclensis]